jgi:hypothetical protein
MTNIKHLFIVGAGFSWNAGLPLTNEFTQKLLDVRGRKLHGPSKLIVSFLHKFVETTFDHQPNSSPKDWPHLEDIFTCIDLSANTGHHLGPEYSPSYLRTVRRALIVRIIRMLRQNYTLGLNKADSKWTTLEDFFSSVPSDKCAFLSMNWDTVIEEGLKRTQKILSFDYGCDAKSARIDKPTKRLLLFPSKNTVHVLKPHGSANWMYCDACRQVFWLSPENTEWVASQLFKNSDWQIVHKVTGEKKKSITPYKCPNCSASALGTRFATFSYRKALDFPMHERSWDSAEKLLWTAKTWIFIGYSLPAADYEFKLLLKRVQLSRQSTPDIVLITGGASASEAVLSYNKFFGPRISKVFKEGLNPEANEHLRKIGALQLPTRR